tara:strand:- start:309 stop:485 length:177 start_codon:yes stop_codon:yes gene_type:complete
MTKKIFEINDILNAVNSISEIEKKDEDPAQIKKNNILTLNTELKSSNKNVLVLDKAIE